MLDSRLGSENKELVNQDIQVCGEMGMQTVAVEKIIAFIEQCHAGFSYVFDDSIGTMSYVYSQCASDRTPPHPPELRISFNASLFLILKPNQCQVLLTDVC